MNKKIALSMTALILAALACSTVTASTNTVVGSGHRISEVRQVPSFTSIELAGSADVNVLLADAESVNVEADDNIVPLIETTVVNDRLVINTKPLTNFTSTQGVVVTVAMKSLKRAVLSGSGNMNIGHMAGSDLGIELPGSGNIRVEGTVDQLSISLAGSGDVMCNQLKAHSATVTLAGSGTVDLYADRSVDAKLVGSGTIRYEGNPPQVTKSITGSGSITP